MLTLIECSEPTSSCKDGAIEKKKMLKMENKEEEDEDSIICCLEGAGSLIYLHSRV